MNKEDRVRWFREARFGMFVHWGVYSLLGKAEWIMHIEDIPRDEYRKIAERFNPQDFDADEWAAIASAAGMRYIVITAKHHDGFAMFKSHCSDYNIVDATPFGRDPMAELANACATHGLRLCFYYSHVQDWYEHRVGWDYPRLGREGKEWWVVTDEEREVFAGYYEGKVKPQIRELLTQYGPIGVLWFDTPNFFTREQALDLARLVRELQPACLINGRILDAQLYPERIDDIDYEGMGDNEVPPLPTGIDWEAPVTTHNGWGFRDPANTVWKDQETLLRHLVRMSASGGNYLLNVGPSPLGEIPEPAVSRLRYIGRWLDANGDSIYGTRGNPFGHDFEWGTVTYRPNRLFLHVTHPAIPEIVINGLDCHVDSARLLADTSGLELDVAHDDANVAESRQLRVRLPLEKRDPVDTVVVLETSGPLNTSGPIAQLENGSIVLPGPLAVMHRGTPDSTMRIAPNGTIAGWYDPQDWVEWTFRAAAGGRYSANVVYRADFWGKNKWDFGHEYTLAVGDSRLPVVVTDEGEVSGEGGHLTRSTMHGQVELPTPGVYTLSITPRIIKSENRWGLRIQSVILTPESLD
jgi:alpha-L-fucosidase